MILEFVMTDVKIIDEYITFLSDSKKTAQNTLSAYKRDLTSFCDYLAEKKVSIVNADSAAVAEFKQILVKNGKSVATVSRCMSSLRSFYKYLSANDIVTDNPAREIKNDKSEKKFFEVLTEDEIDALLAQPDTSDFKGRRDKAMLETLYATGVKVSELISFDLSDVNLKMNYIRCRTNKGGGNDRVILLYPTAVKELEEYMRHSRKYFVSDPSETALFVNVNGERMTRQGFWKILKSYAESAHISKTITPHTLRHSFATHLLENGADIHDIKNILGHADISSTQIYSEFIKSRLNTTYLRFNHRSR